MGIIDVLTAPVRATQRALLGEEKIKVGAAGGIGQPLALLLKLSPFCSELSLFDVAPFTPGVAVDLSHTNTSAKVTAHVPSSREDTSAIDAALTGCQLVMIPAGVPRKPGMTRDDLFNINAGILAGVCESIARVCPTAWVCIITNPVNSTVPIARNIFKAAGCYNPARLFGVTTLDCVRASAFVAAALGVAPEAVSVPVVGGHAGATILPLLSQCSHSVAAKVSTAEMAALTTRIQNAGTEVVDAKAGAGSATLSMAYAAFVFAENCMRAMNGYGGIVQCAYVDSPIVPECAFFAQRVQLGRQGVVKQFGLGRLSDTEAEGLKGMTAQLAEEIAKGDSWTKPC